MAVTNTSNRSKVAPFINPAMVFSVADSNAFWGAVIASKIMPFLVWLAAVEKNLDAAGVKADLRVHWPGDDPDQPYNEGSPFDSGKAPQGILTAEVVYLNPVNYDTDDSRARRPERRGMMVGIQHMMASPDPQRAAKSFLHRLQWHAQLESTILELYLS